MAHTGKYIERDIKKTLVNTITRMKRSFPNSHTDVLADYIIDHIEEDYWTVDIGVDYWKRRALEAEAKLKESVSTTNVGINNIVNEYPLFDKAHTTPKSDVIIPKEPKAPTEAEKPKPKSFFNFG